MRARLFWPLWLIASVLPGCRQASAPETSTTDGRTYVGVGLVSGLRATGDGDTPALRKLLTQAYPDRKFDADELRNWALVAVVARASDADAAHPDVAVHSVGTATSLKGGTLLRTTLSDPADPSAHVVVEGPLVLRPDSSFSAGVSRGPTPLRR